MSKTLLLSLLFLIVTFFSFTDTVKAAADLSVICGQTTCAVSSKDPIFTSSDTWTPNKSVTKEIVITNTDSQDKDIFIKAVSDGNGSLDDYMQITLSNTTPNTLWSGTLTDFIHTDSIDIASLQPGKTFHLLISAQMKQDTPNSLQGTSSQFNFGFGFEKTPTQNEDNTTDDTNTSSSNQNSSSQTNANNNNENNIVQNAQNSIAQLTGGFFTNLFPQIDSVLAAENNDEVLENVRNPVGEVLQAGDKDVCEQTPLWPLILFAQLFLLIGIQKKLSNKTKVLASIGTVLLSGGVLFLLVCVKLLALTALVPGIYNLFAEFYLKNKETK